MRRILIAAAIAACMCSSGYGQKVQKQVIVKAEKGQVKSAYFYYECSKCEKILRFKKDDGGKHGQCYVCKRTFRLPVFKKVVQEIIKTPICRGKT